MGGSNQETTTSGWAPALGQGENILGLAESIFNSQMGSNVPTMGTIGTNSNLQNAWNSMSGSGMNQLAQQLGQTGAGMMGNLNQLGGLYEQIGAGMNTYNMQNARDTALADREGYLADSDAAIMNQLNDAIATSTGGIYGAAAGGGNVGSSRTQLATGQAAGQLSSGAHATMAGIRNNAFDTATNQAMAMEQQRLQGLQAQAGGILQQAGLGSQMLNQAGNVYQQGMNNMLQAGLGQQQLEYQNSLINYQNQMNQYNKPMQLLGWYNQMVSPWVGAESTSTASGGGGLMSGIMGIGGAIAGGIFGGPAGATAGANIGGNIGGAF